MDDQGRSLILTVGNPNIFNQRSVEKANNLEAGITTKQQNMNSTQGSVDCQDICWALEVEVLEAIYCWQVNSLK